MPWRPRRPGRPAFARQRGFAAADAAARPATDPLVRLVSRFLVAQSGASAAIALAYSRRNLPLLTLMIIIAVAICGLAAIVRSGSHAAWLITVCTEAAVTAVGLFRFGYADYLGGTLLAMITLGTLLRPAVARAFAGPVRQPGDVPAAAMAEAAPDALQEPVAG